MVLIIFAALHLAAFGGPKEEAMQDERVKRTASDFFRKGAASAAVAHLKQNLRAETGRMARRPAWCRS